MDEIIETVRKRYQKAKERRANWESHWQECYDYALPQRGGAMSRVGEGGDRRNDRLFESDPEVNKRLHAAGFSQKQAQLVYDLAAERLLPMLHGLAEDYEARRNLEKIHSHFGGEERWREVSRQLLAWGSKKLPEEVLRALGTSFEGVLALHKMMVSEEPALGRGVGMGAENLDQEALTKLMEDPRYWRDHDPSIFNRVSEGFRRLYPDKKS